MTIQDRLFALQDTGYRDFHSKLMPADYDKGRIIGVRTPQLRKLAKDFAKEEGAGEFLRNLPHTYYEEDNLHAFLIEAKAKTFDEALAMTEDFLPYIDNWATCDMFRPKAFRKDLPRLYTQSIDWIRRDHTYTVRYGIVTQMTYFLEPDTFDPAIFDVLTALHREEYYINMALAWYYSMALVKQYEATLPLLTEKRLDKWVHNKAIQKGVESQRIDKETKDYLRSLRIK